MDLFKINYIYDLNNDGVDDTNILEAQKGKINKIESDKEYEKYLYRSFRKYGLEAFTFEVIEECPPEELSNREIYWISYYDSYANGYNETPGGEIIWVGGEKHPNHKLTKEDVIYIRQLWASKTISTKEMYYEFANKIGKSGFKKI